MRLTNWKCSFKIYWRRKVDNNEKIKQILEEFDDTETRIATAILNAFDTLSDNNQIALENVLFSRRITKNVLDGLKK